MDRFKKILFQPIDVTWLACFRILFGLITLFDTVQYFKRGWIQENYIDTIYHFKFFGFEWVQPPPGYAMGIYFFLLAILSIGILLGYQFRFSIITFFFAYTYMWLIDLAFFVEWNYLISLIAFLFIFMPAGKMYSLDNLVGRKPNISSTPSWTLWILRFQIAVVYIFGGIHKLNTDWINGDLVRGWLAYGYPMPFLGRITFYDEWFVRLLTWTGIGVDLFIIPLLLFRTTRPWALIIAIVFHLNNSHWFPVGIFPYIMIAGTLLYVDPQWFRKLVPQKKQFNSQPPDHTQEGIANHKTSFVVVLICIYALLQILVPLRTHFYPGNPDWTEEGARFSWFLYTRNKTADVYFVVIDQDDKSYVLKKDFILSILTKRQYYYLSIYPNCTLQFAHFLNQRLSQDGINVKKIMAKTLIRLNMRDPQPLIDPNANLLDFKPSLSPKNWLNLS